MNSEAQLIQSKTVIPVVGVIFDGEKILLSKRYAPGKSSHDKWQLVGGGIEYGEHPIDTLKRELKEEVGLEEIELLSSKPVIMTHVYEDTQTHVIVIAYAVKYIGGEIDFSHDEETSDARWFRYEEIDFLNALPNTKEIIDEMRLIL